MLMKLFNFGLDKFYLWYILFYWWGYLFILSFLVLVIVGLLVLGFLLCIEDLWIDMWNVLIII